MSILMYFYSAFEVCVKKSISYYIWISPKFLRLFEIQEPELSLYNQYNHRLSDTMCHRDTFVFALKIIPIFYHWLLKLNSFWFDFHHCIL